MVALFVALGGVSYAAATIGSAEIENNSVRSKDVKNGDLRGKDLKANTIGGSRVLESSLGQVPSAANADSATKATSADSATSAANAETLDGVDGAQYVRVKTRARCHQRHQRSTQLRERRQRGQLSNLAGGQYTVSAKLQVDNDTSRRRADRLRPDAASGAATQLDSSEQDLGGRRRSAQELNYVLIGTFTATAAGTDDLFVRCEQAGGDNDVDEVRIIATLVN